MNYLNRYMTKPINIPEYPRCSHKFAKKNIIQALQKLLEKWVQGCEICIKAKRIPNSSITPELLNLPEWDLGPEGALQIDLLPNLPPAEVTKTS